MVFVRREQAENVIRRNRQRINDLREAYKDAVYGHNGGDYSSIGQLIISYFEEMCEAILWIACEADSSLNGTLRWPAFNEIPKYHTPNMDIPREVRSAAKNLSGYNGKFDLKDELSIDDLRSLFANIMDFANWIAAGEESQGRDDIADLARDIFLLANNFFRYAGEREH